MEDAPAATARAARNFALRGRYFWFFLVAAFALVLDQVTKAIVDARVSPGDAWPSPEWDVRIINITNSGAAFGMLKGEVELLTVTGVVGVIAIAVFVTSSIFKHPLAYVGLGLILGGALGNLVDRLAKGEVLDFVKFPNYPAFNAADSCITIGIVLLLWHFLFNSQPASESEKPEHEAG
jgi:signal peptidase II